MCGMGYFLPKRLNLSPSSHQIEAELSIKFKPAIGLETSFEQTCEGGNYGERPWQITATNQKTGFLL
jgi:hypothetical protein